LWAEILGKVKELCIALIFASHVPRGWADYGLRNECISR